MRISTNVLDEAGERAIGTRVSAQVYRKVVEEGQVWHDRAFVVTDWYKTAYEPIRNISDDVIGILYVGTLEQPFQDIASRILKSFMQIVGGVMVLGVVLSLFLAGSISKPLTEVVRGTECLASGDWGYEVNTHTPIHETNSLAEAFNAMAVGLKEREESLRVSNEKLIVSNKSYIDLIGFVAHELKGILASAVMNAYAVRDGYLGMINFKQRKALDSVTRNMDARVKTNSRQFYAATDSLKNPAVSRQGGLKINTGPCTGPIPPRRAEKLIKAWRKTAMAAL